MSIRIHKKDFYIKPITKNSYISIIYKLLRKCRNILTYIKIFSKNISYFFYKITTYKTKSILTGFIIM